MAFDLDGISKLVGAATSGATSIITAAKGNTKATSATVGFTPSVGAGGSSSNVMGIAILGVIVLAAVKMFTGRRR